MDYAHDNGVLVISATGFLGSCSGQVAFPARFENSMAVGATTDEDLLATFSNTGNELDVSAPGDRIWSTWPGNSYRLLNGTSMPTAFVTGLAGLTKSYYPSITHVDIRDILSTTADDLGVPGRDDQFGFGRINAFNALTLLTGAFGACCESTPDLGGICTNGVLEDDCNGPQQQWNQRATCAQIGCDEARGACCDMDAGPLATGGDCTTDVLRSDCQCDQCVWTKGARCSDVPCPAIFVAIPTVSEWSLVILTLLLLTGAKIFFGRRAHEEWR